MAYDMTRCPQTEAEFREYFYALIGRALGGPADDFEAVLEQAYPWQGQPLKIPPGVGPGITQPPGAPFFGLTQQYSGGPKARVFLPAATPDDLGYYTRCMQYVDDAAQTLSASKQQPAPHATGLVWAWYLAGPDNAYAPIQPAGGTTPVPPPSGLTEADVQAMIDDSIAQALEALVANGLRAHGAVNLPIVVESLTSMRAKGDIDVQVTPGQATPPADTSSGGPSTVATILVLRRLLERGDEAPS